MHINIASHQKSSRVLHPLLIDMYTYAAPTIPPPVNLPQHFFQEFFPTVSDDIARQAGDTKNTPDDRLCQVCGDGSLCREEPRETAATVKALNHIVVFAIRMLRHVNYSHL